MEDTRRFNNEFALRIASLNQQREMQANSEAASAAGQMRGIAASFAQNQMNHAQDLQRMGLGAAIQNFQNQQQFGNQQALQNAGFQNAQSLQQAGFGNQQTLQQQGFDFRQQQQDAAIQRQQASFQAAQNLAPWTQAEQSQADEITKLQQDGYDYGGQQKLQVDDLRKQQQDLVVGLRSGQVHPSARASTEANIRALRAQELGIKPAVKRQTLQEKIDAGEMHAVLPDGTNVTQSGDGIKAIQKNPGEQDFAVTPDAAPLYQNIFGDASKPSVPGGAPDVKAGHDAATEGVRRMQLFRMGPERFATQDLEGKIAVAQATLEAQNKGLGKPEADLHVMKAVKEAYDKALKGDGASGGAKTPAAVPGSAPANQAPAGATPPAPPQEVAAAAKEVGTTPEMLAKAADVRNKIAAAGPQAFRPATPEEFKQSGQRGTVAGYPVYANANEGHARLDKGTIFLDPMGGIFESTGQKQKAPPVKPAQPTDRLRFQEVRPDGTKGPVMGGGQQVSLPQAGPQQPAVDPKAALQTAVGGDRLNQSGRDDAASRVEQLLTTPAAQAFPPEVLAAAKDFARTRSRSARERLVAAMNPAPAQAQPRPENNLPPLNVPFGTAPGDRDADATAWAEQGILGYRDGLPVVEDPKDVKLPRGTKYLDPSANWQVKTVL